MVQVEVEQRSPFSIHAPPRGATPAPYQQVLYSVFQFTPLREGRRTVHHLTCAGSPDFNSRPSARGDQRIQSEPENVLKFQFTPLREGRRLEKLGGGLILCISIHAPPRGATGEPCAAAGRGAISIHAPPRGATIIVKQIRAHLGISIHAPPRGATVSSFIHFPSCVISIHAPPRGATAAPPPNRRSAAYFNSRPSARGDSSRRGTASRQSYFNSRPSARGDSNAVSWSRL